MSADRDLTAIVESVARDWHDRRAANERAAKPDAHIPTWEVRDAMSKHSIREAVLPIVTATLRAIDEADA